MFRPFGRQRAQQESLPPPALRMRRLRKERVMFRFLRKFAGSSSCRTKPRRVRLGLELLEDRLTPSTFTVITTADNGDNVNPLAGSLRQAILQANAHAGPDIIDFAIPGAGVKTISPTKALPVVTGQTT